MFRPRRYLFLGLFLCAGGCQSTMLSSPAEIFQRDGNFSQHLSAARLIEQQGELLRAEQHYQKLLRKYPHRYEVHQRMGVLAQKRGESRQAVEALQQARQLAPMNANVLGDLGYALYLAGRYEEAVDVLQQGQQINPSHQRIQSNLAMALVACRQVSSAMTILRQSSDESAAHTSVGFALAQHGHIEESRRHFELALDLNPNHKAAAEALVQLAHRTTAGDRDGRHAPEYVPAERISMIRLRDAARPGDWNDSEQGVESARPSLDGLVERTSFVPTETPATPPPFEKPGSVSERSLSAEDRESAIVRTAAFDAPRRGERVAQLLHVESRGSDHLGTWAPLPRPFEEASESMPSLPIVATGGEHLDIRHGQTSYSNSRDDEAVAAINADDFVPASDHDPAIADAAGVPSQPGPDELRRVCRSINESWSTRIDAAARLAVLEPEQGFDLLVTMLSQAPECERPAIWKHLRDDPPTASSFGPRLLTAFGGTRGRERIEAALTIGRIYGWRDFAVEAIEPLSQSDDPDICNRARDALALINP